MRLSRATACLVLCATGAAAEPVRLASHRAVYDLSLAQSGGTRAVESARGRIVIEFSGDACKGYTMQTRQVTVLESGETGSRTSDLRNTTFEGADGRSYRFKVGTLLNGAPGQSVDGTAEIAAEALKIRLKEPKREVFEASGPVLFPTAHMRRLIEAAREGTTTLSVKVYDGTDDGRKVYDTLAVIGHAAPAKGASPKGASPKGASPKEAAPKEGASKEGASKEGASKDESGKGDSDRDKPLRQGDMAGMPHWPVTLSYFTAGSGERTPIYVLTFDLYENGVSGNLRLDYGEFAVAGNLTRLDRLPTATDCKS